jgi:Xaa-Pro aminopeptidase
VLGPRWERYGDTPNTPIRESEVYTLELGVDIPGRGYFGLEEIVAVREGGVEWLSNRPSQVGKIED